MIANCIALHLTLVTACLSITGCDETVTSDYATRADAEADQLFERAWLPEIIPPSSRDIVTKNDLDLNTSTGEFHFDPADRAAFVAQLTRLASRDEKDQLGYSYETWVFLLDRTKPFCRYEFKL
jgi:hypothetical protein